MVLGYWLPTRIVIGVSNGWLATAIITFAILLGAWKLIVVLRRSP